MKKGFHLLTALTIIAVFAVSCNFPILTSPQDPGEIGPNLTLTALFDTSMNIPPTVTPAHLWAAWAAPAESDIP